MLRNIKRLQIQTKSFENVYRSVFFGKAAGPQYAILLKNRLHYKRFSNNLSTF